MTILKEQARIRWNTLLEKEEPERTGLPRVILHRCREDFGPVTMTACLASEIETDPYTLVIEYVDDTVFHPQFVERMLLFRLSQ